MAKFGLFSGGNVVADQEFEGDYMRQTGEYVTIFVTSKTSSVVDAQVAAIKLDKGQSVKKLS